MTNIDAALDSFIVKLSAEFLVNLGLKTPTTFVDSKPLALFQTSHKSVWLKRMMQAAPACVPNTFNVSVHTERLNLVSPIYVKASFHELNQ